ncbi:MAG: hypothetical protein Kow0090_04580 [Myxococcota bacterium]
MERYRTRLTSVEVEELKPKAGEFHIGRCEAIRSLEFLPRLEIETSLVLHLIPLVMLKKDTNYLKDPELITYIMNFTRGFKGYRYNREGILIYDAGYPSGVAKSYFQFFRNGIFEFYTSEIFDERKPKYIRAELIERLCIEVVERSQKQLLDKLGIIPPLVVCASLYGLRDKAILPPERFEQPEVNRFDIDSLTVLSVLLKDYDADIPKAFRDGFDVMWQSSGWSQSPFYDASGDWSGRGKKKPL